MVGMTESTSSHLWLDDERPAPPGWSRVHTAEEAIEFLAKRPCNIVSLDHDLGEDAGTGYDVLLWIERHVFEDANFQPPDIRIHTANISARTKMELGVESINRRMAGRRAPGNKQR